MQETKTKEQLLQEYEVDQQQGLSHSEAAARLERDGPNELPAEKKKSWIKTFFSQMNDPMIFILFAAILISLGISIYEQITTGEASWLDSIVIFIVILVNAIIGTVQEMKAENALEALKKLSAPTCIVRRDGELLEVRAKDLVLGDIVILEEGRTVPADLRLLEAINMKVDESSLTGESVPVEKDASVVFDEETPIGDRSNMVYSSTPITYGRGEGIVVGAGVNTEIGKIAGMLSETEEEKTPLQKRLNDLSKLLGIVAIVIVVLMLVIGLIQQRDWLDMLMTAISLAVAAVPEGLTAVVTITLAIGVQEMVKVNSIVRKLPSVETLGSVSVICSDKTGTLTQNKMTVTNVYVNGKRGSLEEFAEHELDQLAGGMSLASNASVDHGVYGDPTEIALVEFANNLDLRKDTLEEKTPRINELPFDSNRKMMSTAHQLSDQQIVFTKGAIDRILLNTTRIEIDGVVRDITPADIDEINAANKAMSDEALRVLALAKTEYDGNQIKEENLIFIGFVGMVDPPRPEAKEAVKSLKGAGVTTIMITGDHRDTAFAIAKELGIADQPSQTMIGTEIDALSEEELQEAVKTVRVFARVSPENKVQIVKALKANGNIVSMTGDGVNDAPSLKAADIGVAMGITGTDVAKSAADMVLTDDNFASIEKAVELGRGIYANIKKTVWFLLSSNFGEVILMLLAILLNIELLPMVASQILFVNLVTDTLPALALGSDKGNPGVMNEKPRDPDENIFAHGGIATTVGYGALIAVMAFIAFLMPAFLGGATNIASINAFYGANPDQATLAQTYAFSVLAVSQLFHMLGMVDQKKSFVHTFSKKHWLIWVAFAVGILLQIAVTEIPFMNVAFYTSHLSWKDWGLVLLFSIAPLIVHEIVVLVRWINGKVKTRKENNVAV